MSQLEGALKLSSLAVQLLFRGLNLWVSVSRNYEVALRLCHSVLEIRSPSRFPRKNQRLCALS